MSTTYCLFYFCYYCTRNKKTEG